MQSSATAPPDIQELRNEVEKVMESVREYDQQIDERNQQRLVLIEQLRDLLPQEQFEKFEKIITQTIEAVQPAPDPSEIPPIEIDENKPLESLRQIRCQIAKEVCKVMDVDSNI